MAEEFGMERQCSTPSIHIENLDSSPVSPKASPKGSPRVSPREALGNPMSPRLSRTSMKTLSDAPPDGKQHVDADADCTEVTVKLECPVAHSHAHWRAVGQGFTELLRPEFIDLVLKVRSPPGSETSINYIGAHRTILAAGWPKFRDQLKEPKEVPLQLREESLSWVSSLENDEDKYGKESGKRTLSFTSQMSGEKEQIAKSLTEDLDEITGTVDLSSWSWGTWNVARALVGYLYGKQIWIHERDMCSLLEAALFLGCGDEVQKGVTKPNRIWKQPDHKIDPSSGDAGKVPKLEVPLLASDGVARTVSSVASQKSQLSFTSEASNHSDGKDAPNFAKDSDELDKELGLKGASTAASSEVHAIPSGNQLIPPSLMPLERDASVSSGGTAISRVLSDLKRNIVEASRKISDYSFSQVYEIIEGDRGILGEGINGPVRMAKHKTTGKEVAVKRISCVNLSEQRRQMLMSEVRIFLQVSHPNIVQLLEVFESTTDQAVLLVMELCTGKELFERLAERKWYSEYDAARMTKQMLDAVTYLHSQNICHRDLKLENWLYENPSPNAKLKLCDFGFGQIVEPSVQLTATLGSLYYVAPEVLEGSYGLPCDIWSIGVIVYMLLMGNPPFNGKNDAEVISKVKAGRLAKNAKNWDKISQTGRYFVQSLLRKDPSERFTATEAAQHAWLRMDFHPRPGTVKGSPEADLSIDQGVVLDMQKFAQNNAITRAALGMLSSKSTATLFGDEEDIRALEEKFKVYDSEGTGMISWEDFIRVLRECLQISFIEAKQVFEKITGASTVVRDEEQGDSTAMPTKQFKREVNYAAFIDATKVRRMAMNTATIREAFRAFEQKGNRYVSLDDLHEMFGEDCDANKLKDIMKMCHGDGDGLVDYNEFAEVFSKEMSSKVPRQDSKLEAKLDTPIGGSSDKKMSEDVNEAAVRQVSGISTGDQASVKGVLEDKVPVDPSPTSLTSPGVEPKESPRFDNTVQDVVQQGSADGGPLGIMLDTGTAFEGRPDAVDESTDKDEQVVGRDRKSEVEEEEDQNEDEGSDDEVEEQLVSHDLTTSMESRMQNTRSPDPRAFSLSLAGSSEYDEVESSAPGGTKDGSKIPSLPSDNMYEIKQFPGFHSRILRPFYAAKPVSNIVMGLIRGTSLYARQSVMAKLATIIHTTCGWFFIMPNPKKHGAVTATRALLSNEEGHFRFVAWWIHPRFVPQLRQWFERITYEGMDQDMQEQQRREQTVSRSKPHEKKIKGPSEGEKREAKADSQRRDKEGKEGGIKEPGAGTVAVENDEAKSAQDPRSGQEDPKEKWEDKEPPKKKDLEERGQRESPEHAAPGRPQKDKEPLPMGQPGDLQFSDVPKPEQYLHTYRDLHKSEHTAMLLQLKEGMHRFLISVFDERFLEKAQIACGFHYPVRTQYSTLHLQVHINAGTVARDDGRGISLETLITSLQRDPHIYVRDEELLRYRVTENVKVSLLAAADDFKGTFEYAAQCGGSEPARQTGALAFELGYTGMPTILDEEMEDDDADGENRNDDENASPSPDHDGATLPPKIPKEEQTSFYIVNMQPAKQSAFSNLIYSKRKEMEEIFGPDSTFLFPCHVSVTGFFETTDSQLKIICKMLTELVEEAKTNQEEIWPGFIVGNVLSTETGYVLLDVKAPPINSVSRDLAAQASKIGVRIRAKAVNHVSLAADRPDPVVRKRIEALYADLDTHQGSFDLVLSRIIHKSSFEELSTVGPHHFAEVLRIPIITCES